MGKNVGVNCKSAFSRSQCPARLHTSHLILRETWHSLCSRPFQPFVLFRMVPSTANFKLGMNYGIFSTGGDNVICIWNLEEATVATEITCHPDLIHSVSFNCDGSLIASTCKDKKLRIIDPRSGEVKKEVVNIWLNVLDLNQMICCVGLHVHVTLAKQSRECSVFSWLKEMEKLQLKRSGWYLFYSSYWTLKLLKGPL